MNWLEVGCPHCPNVLTLPRAAAGRTIRCPECDKSYLVPTPSAASAEAPAHSPEPVPASASEESLPASSSGAEYQLAPTTDFTPTPESAIERAPVETPPAPKPMPPAPKPPEPRRANVEAEMELASSSPLAEIPILAPPGGGGPRSIAGTVRAAAHGPPPSPPESPHLSAEPAQAEPTASLLGPMPPLGPPAPSGRETTEEAQLRMHRAELRTRVNLVIFVIGTIVMIAFAWLVIQFSKPG